MKKLLLRHCLGLFLLGGLWAPELVLAEQESQILLDVQGRLEEGNIKLDNGSLLNIYEVEILSDSPLFILAESDEFDTFLGLLDSEGNKIADNDNFDGSNAGILLDKIQPGKYKIGVINHIPDEIGQYRLLVKVLTLSELISVKADSLFSQAISFRRNGSSESLLKAIDMLDKAFSLYSEVDNTRQMIASLNIAGIIYSNLGQRQNAITYYENALKLSEDNSDLIGESNSLNNLGLIYLELGENDKAIYYFEKSLSIAKKINDHLAEGITLNNIGRIYLRLGEPEKTLDYLDQYLIISKQTGNYNAQANALNNIGQVYSDLGNKEKALSYFQDSLIISSKIKDLPQEANTLNNIGSAYSDLGQNYKSLDYYQKSLLITKKNGDLSQEAIILNNIGSSYWQLGEVSKSLAYFEKSLAIRRETNDFPGQGIMLNNIGQSYSELGNIQRAINYFEEALVIRQKVGDRHGESVTGNNIGSAYLAIEEYEKALEYFQKSLIISQEIGAKFTETSILNNIGIIYSDLEQEKNALDNYNKALALSIEIGNLSVQQSTLNNIAFSYKKLGENEKALNYYEQAFRIAKEINEPSGQAVILSNIGYLKLDEKKYDVSTDYLTQSINAYELINSSDLTDDLKISYFQTYLNNYSSLQQSLLAQGNITEAIEIAERGRARALVELLNKRFSGRGEFIPTEKPSIAELKAIAKNENSSLVTYTIFKRDNAHKIYAYVITPSGKTEFREVDLAATNVNLSEIVQSARNIVTQRPGDQKEGSRSATGVESNEFAVGEYVKLKGEFPTDEPWQITAIDREKGIVTLDQTLREAPLENVSLERIASKTNTPLEQLHQILIEPIAELLPTDPAERVIFMPQGALFGVPFPALQDKQGTYLLEKHTILTSPSIQVLAQTAQQNQRLAKQDRKPGQPLIVGNPYPYPQGLASLENAGKEATEIANLLGTKPLLGKEATEAQVLAQMPNADILHFATHASFNDQNGIQSAIYLTAEPGAPDDDLFQTPGRITAEEIFNQFENNPLNARIAVLSACDTGQGEITGDGVIGLSRSLIAAGVPSVLVSLWSVNDASTATLMTEFYRQWQTDGVDKATALRNAMLKLKEQYPEPYYWSAFTLIGEAD